MQKQQRPLVLLYLIVTVVVYVLMNMELRHRSQIDNIRVAKEALLVADTIASMVEKKVMDSIKAQLEDVQTRLKKDSMELRKLRQQNARLEKLYRDIDVSDRPHY